MVLLYITAYFIRKEDNMKFLILKRKNGTNKPVSICAAKMKGGEDRPCRIDRYPRFARPC